jgi:hypothetical protein
MDAKLRRPWAVGMVVANSQDQQEASGPKCMPGACSIGVPQDQKPVIRGVNFIDLSGKKGELRKKPEENGFDPKLFSAIGTIVPDQEIIDPNLANWQDLNTPAYIEKSEYAYPSTSFMVSPCHVLASYHSVFGGAVNPKLSDFSATVTLTSPATGNPIILRHAQLSWAICILRNQSNVKIGCY